MIFFRLCGLVTVFAIFLASCASQNKLPKHYLETVADTTGKGVVKNVEPRIQKNDLLSIQVYSASTIPEVDALYNLPNQGAVTQAGKPVSGFLVDQRGNIEFPRIGTIHAEGLTKQELADIIKGKLVGQLTDPSVIVRFLSFRITVIGEVGNPGSYDIPTERVTILEALGLAGDIPITGKKENVKVIRESNGDREIGTIDLTSKDFFESPYYNLQQNDVVIVEPTKQRKKQLNEQTTNQRITLGLAIVTTLTLLYSVFR